MALHDIELALMEYLTNLAYTVTSTPADLKERLPVIRVARIGGGEDRAHDNPRVSLQCFALETPNDPRAAQDLAAAVWEQMHKLPAVSEGVRMDSASKDSGPVAIPWPTPGIGVKELVYTVTVRH